MKLSIIFPVIMKSALSKKLKILDSGVRRNDIIAGLK
jgi:hypothetical protein